MHNIGKVDFVGLKSIKHNSFHIATVIGDRCATLASMKRFVFYNLAPSDLTMKFRRPNNKVLVQPKASDSRLPALFSGTVVLSTLTWTAYLVGIVYQQTLLEKLGVDSDLYPKESVDYFVFAFLASASSLTSIVSYMLSNIIVVGLIFLFWSGLMGVSLLSKKIEQHRWMRKLESKINGNKKIAFNLAIPVVASIFTIYIPIFLAFVAVVPIIVGTTAGKREAERYMKVLAEECNETNINSSSCTIVTEGGVTIATGIVIAASEKYVAILEKGGSRSITLEGREFSKMSNKLGH